MLVGRQSGSHVLATLLSNSCSAMSDFSEPKYEPTASSSSSSAPTSAPSTSTTAASPVKAAVPPPASVLDRVAASGSWADEEVESELGEQLRTQSTVTETKAPVKADHLIETADEVKVIPADADSPLLSASKFEDLSLPPELLKGVYDMKYNVPSKIQAKALPILLGKKPVNMIAQSQSGTGKTACFSLSMLSAVDLSRLVVQALCICPTRELAQQIYANVRLIGKHCQARVELFVAGDSLKKKEKIQAHILIGTTGKILSLIDNQNFDPKLVQMLVLDEADQMLNEVGAGMGGSMAAQTMKIKNAVHKKELSVLLFSATYSPEVEKFAKGFVPQPRTEIFLQKTEVARKQIRQVYVKLNSEEHKFKFLEDLYSIISVGQSIIFCNRKKVTKDLTARLNKLGLEVSLLHGTDADMSPEQRDAVVLAFRRGKTRVLITTDVLSRGFDVPSVTLVINYDLPVNRERSDLPDAETYIHRIGRSGRYDAPGLAVNFVLDDQDMRVLQSIEKYQSKPIEPCQADVDQIERLLSLK